jgi:hypothetical protein
VWAELTASTSPAIANTIAKCLSAATLSSKLL